MAFPPFLVRISAVFGSRRKAVTILTKWRCVALLLLLRSADVLIILPSGSGRVNDRLFAFDFQAEALPKGLRTRPGVPKEVPGAVVQFVSHCLRSCFASCGGFKSHCYRMVCENFQ